MGTPQSHFSKMGFRATTALLLLALPVIASAFSISSSPTVLGLRQTPALCAHNARSSRAFSHASVNLRMQEQNGDTNSESSAPGKATDNFPDMVPVESTNPAFFVIGGIIGCVPIAIFLIETCKVSIGFVPDQCRAPCEGKM